MASPSPSTWHSITPSTRPLSLSILELTPLALTLSLTLAIPSSSSSSNQSHSASGSASTSLHHHQQSQQRRKKRHPHAHAHGHGHSHGRSRIDSDDDTAVELDDSDSIIPGAWPVLNGEVRFKDLLSHGVVVSVNGQPWNRIVAHVSDADDEEQDDHEHDEHDAEEEEEWEDEPSHHLGHGHHGEEGNMTRRRPRRARFSLSAGNAAREAGLGEKRRKEKKSQGDRAVVVVYGLSPGKEYEIELRVVGMFGEGADGIVSSSVLIPPSPSPNPGLHPRSRANSLRSRSNPRSRSNSVNAPPESPTSGRATPPANSDLAPPIVAPTPILSPSDAQAAQLRQHIAAAHAEKEHLQNQIKEARRASQRAEAALRVEIETVKRAIEKAGTMDMRAKQKALALQEQVKQGWAGAEAAEKEMHTVENGLADLERVFEEVKLELDTIKDEWKIVKEREDEVRERERKARVEEDKKLAEVVGKVDKLKARKEKKESERMELEHKLEELERQREEVERRNEEQKHRRNSGYWPGAGGIGHRPQWDNSDPHDASGPGRPLSTHPSLTNLSGHGPHGYAGAQRGGGGRGGYGPRFPSNGPVRPSINPPQPSPTHTQHASAAFYGPASPSVRPPRSVSAAPSSNNIASPSPVHRAISGGVNASAAPFHPTQNPNPTSSYAGNGNAGEHHTTMMPPQLQHRIYLPNMRPRPSPNFHPPPSVLAERQSSPTTLSPPQFPPLPGTTTSSGIGPTAPGAKPGGPSLASIVTRAVLSPTSTLANVASSSGSMPMSMTQHPGPSRTNSGSSSSSPALSQHQAQAQAQQGRINFAPMPIQDKSDIHTHRHPTTGPWASLSPPNHGQSQSQMHGPGGTFSYAYGQGPGQSQAPAHVHAQGQVARTQTPPVMAIGEDRWGRQSPAGSTGSGSGHGGGGR